MRRYYSALLILSAFLSSCSKDTPTSSTPSEFVHAKVGSTFTFDEYSTDSTNAIIVGSRDTSISTVLKTDGVIGSKTGLLVVEENKSGSKDTVYYGYEANNNVSVYLAGSSTALFTIPVGTGIAVNTVKVDTTIDQGNTSITRDSTLISLLAMENITVKGRSISIKKIQFTLHEISMINGAPFINASATNILYYAPSLGYFIKTTSSSRPDPFGGWIDGSFQMLIDYDLK